MTDETDAAFLQAFEETTLSRVAWTHQAHLRMAYLYLKPNPDAAALLPVIRERIRIYNTAQGKAAGYHETITGAFLLLVADRLHQTSSPTFAHFEAEHADLFAPGGSILLRYYEHDTLFSDAARAHFVEPDKEPLP